MLKRQRTSSGLLDTKSSNPHPANRQRLTQSRSHSGQRAQIIDYITIDTTPSPVGHVLEHLPSMDAVTSLYY